MLQTNIHYELTDTFAGEANYSWARRGKIETKQGENFSDLAAIRRVKKALGLAGVRCKVEHWGETIALYPANSCTVCFITFNTFGTAN
jgi:hypothetical protein